MLQLIHNIMKTKQQMTQNCSYRAIGNQFAQKEQKH